MAMSVKERKKLGEVQDLIGNSLAVYRNDRDAHRADTLVPMLEKALRLAISILGKYPPVEGK